MFASLCRIHFLWQASKRHQRDWIYNPATFTVIIILCWLRHMQILFLSRGENAVTYHVCLCIACYQSPSPPSALPKGLGHWLQKDGCIQHLTFKCRLDGSMGDILLEDDIPPRVLIKWFLLQESSCWQIVFENNAVCLDQSILYFLAGKAAGLARQWVRTPDIQALVLALPPGLCGGTAKRPWNYSASLLAPSLAY